MKKTILLSCFLLSACVTNRVLFTDPKTNIKVYEAQCSAYRHTMGDCMIKASETCPNGFITLNTSNTVMGAFNSQSSNFNMSGDLNSNSIGNVGFYGNNAFINSTTNTGFNANANAFSLGGSTIDYRRTLIYICRPTE